MVYSHVHVCMLCADEKYLPYCGYQLPDKILNREIAGEIRVSSESPSALVNGHRIFPFVRLKRS